jgi:hypothetical protein
MLSKKLIWVVAIILIASIVYFISNGFVKKENSVYAGKVILYKDPTCGCCSEYASYLKSNGFNVKIITIDDMASIKQKYGIPSNLESCHTAIFGDYFVEGHVPIEAVEKMLTEKPAINGISLPDMPPGSPGMPGIKNEIFKVYSITDDGYDIFQNI